MRRVGADREESFAITDAKGSYVARGLPPGKYEVSAAQERDWRAAFVVSPVEVVELGTGEARCDLDFPRGKLSGRIVDRLSGAPRKTGYIQLYVPASPAEGQPGGWTLAGDRHLDADRFELDTVPPGTYCVTGSDLPRGPVAGWARAQVADGASVVDVVLALGGEAVLEVEVLDAKGRAIPESSVELRPEDLPGAFKASDGEAGKHRIEKVPPGRYLLEVEAPGHERHSEVLQVGSELQSRMVRLASRT